MKKLLNVSLSIAAVFTLSACTASSQPSPEMAVKLDNKKECSIEQNGIETVIAKAKLFNTEAQKRGLEFRRLGIDNSGLIVAVEEAIKTGAKEINPKDFKGKATKAVFETNYAAERACKFAISALQQAHEGKSTWRLSVPGDGFKY